MKFFELEQIITKEIQNLRQKSFSKGKFKDVKSTKLVEKFNKYKNDLIKEKKINTQNSIKDLEIGTPQKFRYIIKKHLKK